MEYFVTRLMFLDISFNVLQICDARRILLYGFFFPPVTIRQLQVVSCTVFPNVVGLTHSHFIWHRVGGPLTCLIRMYHECYVWQRFLSVPWARRTWLRRRTEAICCYQLRVQY